MSTRTKSAICMLVVIAFFSAPACRHSTGTEGRSARSTEMSTSNMQSALLYVRTSHGLREGVSDVPFDIVVLDSGLIARYDSELVGDVLQTSQLSNSEFDEFVDSMHDFKLLSLPPQVNAPPDGSRTEIGIRHEGEFRRYIWSGADADLAADQRDEFSDAWGEAMSRIRGLHDRMWQPAETPDLIDEIARDLP